MRLTPDHLNPLKERELELRGLQIPVIENLASHQGTYDTLNLTDNSITVLGNIPLSPRLTSIHLAQNQISSISPSLPPNIPNLVSLVLTNNAIASLATLVPLESLTALRHLSLRGNPVTQHEHYKEFVVWKVAKGQLHTLDFERIKDSTRESARKLLTDPETSLPNSLAHQLSIATTSSVSGVGATTFSLTNVTKATAAGGLGTKGGKGRLMTPDEKRRVVEALTRAKTAEEVRKLERMLADGLVPEGGVDNATAEAQAQDQEPAVAVVETEGEGEGDGQAGEDKEMAEAVNGS
ncbi:U2 small nuclear ribonucleoprotein A' [Kwoniella heveanensis BCC8398]|uniref:U2 small nuclear ribonucleoprotein A' n=1 Tax=Kwoniella heveanensis BCC8398 TaxID=1296120 RepID=A0A1B9GXC3_9TREE|nr:U2 small nuclear ribonucleoprotein A' [Kwoniella heveanensis BCC8398]